MLRRFAQRGVGGAFRRLGRTRLFIFLAVMGPGLITAASDNDAGGVTTWSVAGSKYGYSLLWVLLLITPILAVTQEMGARMGAVTGQGPGGAHPRTLQHEGHGLRHARHADRQLRHHGGRVQRRGGGLRPGRTCPRGPPSPPVAAGVWLLVTRGNFRRVQSVFLFLTRRLPALRGLRLPGAPRLEVRRPAARWSPALSSTPPGCSPSSPPSARRSRPGVSSSSRRTSSTSTSR